MSTLPFLLSVADELDNINSQSYIDDFGLGFHPHRHYYRNPSIQLNLPANTEWMEERQRCRTHKFVDKNNEDEDDDDDESQNNLEQVNEIEEDDNDDGDDNGDREIKDGRTVVDVHKYSGLNSNEEVDNVDNSTVHRYNLLKKCRKNYHHISRHRRNNDDQYDAPTTSTSSSSAAAATAVSAVSATSHKYHQNSSSSRKGYGSSDNSPSSDDKIQKITSSIEFLTCFLVKKSRGTSKNSYGSGNSKKS